MAQVNVRNRNQNKFDKDGNRKKPNWEYRFEAAQVDGKRKQISKAGFPAKKGCPRCRNECTCRI